MGEAFFYHMTRSTLEETLPVLLGKALDKGWRVALRAPDEARLDRLDERLWLGPQEGFVPHGRAGGPHDRDQPVLLTSGPQTPNGANCLVSVDGAEITAEEVATAARAMVLFDGNDPVAVEAARAQWRALTGAGAKAKYWSQERGSWDMKAES